MGEIPINGKNPRDNARGTIIYCNYITQHLISLCSVYDDILFYEYNSAEIANLNDGVISTFVNIKDCDDKIIMTLG